MKDTAGLDIRTIGNRYRARVATSLPESLPFAETLWARIQPRQWQLEWNLPLWLGAPFGVDRDVCSDVILGNVFGLAFIRLADDLIDGEVEPTDLPPAIALREEFLAAAIEVYGRHFEQHAPFWTHLGRWLEEWQSHAEAAAVGSGMPSAGGLARRAAPLKISAYAMCQLGGRAEQFAPLEQCLDEALAAMVLYDHFCDWRSDLANSRWNAFVAQFGSHAQHPENRAANQASVLAAQLAHGVTRRYFADIHDRLARAAGRARALGIPALAGYLTQLTAGLDQQSALLERRYSDLGAEAVRLVFGRHSPASTERSRA